MARDRLLARLDHHLRELTQEFPHLQLWLQVHRDGTTTDEFRAVYGTEAAVSVLCARDAKERFEELLVTVCRCLFLSKHVRLEWHVSVGSPVNTK